MHLVDQFIRRSWVVMATCLVVFTACGGSNNQPDAIIDIVDVAVPHDTISQDMTVTDGREVSEDVAVDVSDTTDDSPNDVFQEVVDVVTVDLADDDASDVVDAAVLDVVKCVTGPMCANDTDCPAYEGKRCNTMLAPPQCQVLYCGELASPCSENALCVSQVCFLDSCCQPDCSGLECGNNGCGGLCGECAEGASCTLGHCCQPDCGSLECGPDLVCGESCGTCQEGATCKSNHCVCEPQDHLECIAGNSTWIDSCGNVGSVKESCPLACLNGTCVDCETVGKANCSGTCRLLGTDTNCSNCGNVCTDGKVCQSAVCKCPAGEEDCSGTCRLIGTATNCSGCGDTCLSGQSCEDEVCVGIEILVPAGSFWMGGNDSSSYPDELPYHQVTLLGYYIDKTEVTVAAYGECVTAGACTAPSISHSKCNWNVAGKENDPVNCVTWFQSEAYCEWTGKRLPTEAEWEKAARGTDGRKYPWGNETATCNYAVMRNDSGSGCGTNSTMSVGSKSPAGDSPYGLCDMSGNVWEWVADWYGSDYYINSSSSNPTGPASGSVRVFRGGGFSNSAGDVRASYRFQYAPSGNHDGLGFRCCRWQ